MIVVGITGSAATGKTTAAQAFARRRHPVFSADQEVHRLLSADRRTIAAVRRAFPAAWTGHAIDRALLAQQAFGNTPNLARLEAILHPRVRRAERAFVREAARRGVPLAVLEIPLLFETGAERLCDVILVMRASRAVQNARLRARGVGPTRARAMRTRRLSEEEMQRRADYIVDSGMPKPKMLRVLGQIIAELNPPRTKAAARS